MFPPARIVVSVRSADSCSQGIEQAVELARRFNAEVILLHVLAPWSRMPPDELELRRRAADLMLERLVQSGSYFPIGKTVIEGDPVTATLRFVREQKADLLVMSCDPHGVLHLLLHGSMVERVLHEAPCPVWFSPPSCRAFEGSFRVSAVLCAVDLRTDSEAVLRLGGLVSGHFGAKLVAAHVPPKVELVAGVWGLDPDVQEQYEAAVRDEVLHVTPATASAECYILRGDPVEQICSLAARIHAGLLVIGGAHGSGRPGRFRMHASGIVRRAPCPVLSVRWAAGQPVGTVAA